ncbi:hypothetical protein QJS66_09385 [Kocuria rhizophila]|nr:hypothetical protein QJS66_09385 [Kocuria rhizophila]
MTQRLSEGPFIVHAPDRPSTAEASGWAPLISPTRRTAVAGRCGVHGDRCRTGRRGLLHAVVRL